MYIFKNILDIQNHLNYLQKKVGFVPTMGALHEGHLSLIKKSKSQNQLTVCSIFVNPTQFNNQDDYLKYPITINEDIEKLIDAETDILFLPEVKEMYPNGNIIAKNYNLGKLDIILEAAHRPGHFQGVCHIVELLLNIVKPNCLYLGAKDFQQCLVLSHLISTLKNKPELIICETLREADGLAMSSRNRRLNGEDRKKAICICQCLNLIKENRATANFTTIKTTCKKMLENNDFKVDYIELIDFNNVELLENYNSTLETYALIAATINNVRLIDNIKIS